MVPRRSRRWLAGLMLALGGCASTCASATEEGVVGELGNGVFSYTCGGTSDPACDPTADLEFPSCIALGGRFDLEYTLLETSLLDPTDVGIIYIESVNQGFFSGEGDFVAQRRGEAAFIVRQDERVLDLLHLPIVPIDGVRLVGPALETVPDAIELERGETLELGVYPRSLTCAELGGDVAFTADSSDPAVVDLSAGPILLLQGAAPGQATVRVRFGEVERSLAVTVHEGSTDLDSSGTTGPATTTGETDPSTDTDPSTATDTDGTTASPTGGASTSSTTGMAT